ncbi:MAG TPA: rRNA maturation RNase YbeY [Paralcaligenes sp.]|jgi:probable rRNA maturation factor
MSVRLTLAVQYATPAAELPRWRLRRWVRRAVDTLSATASPPFNAITLTLRLVDAAEGRLLNRKFRQKDYATNVLTFEYGIDADGTAGGDIVLCAPVLRSEAHQQKKTLLEHAAHLTVHGVLHAVGYDHVKPDEAEIMEALEIAILGKMGIENPYR